MIEYDGVNYSHISPLEVNGWKGNFLQAIGSPNLFLAVVDTKEYGVHPIYFKLQETKVNVDDLKEMFIQKIE